MRNQALVLVPSKQSAMRPATIVMSQAPAACEQAPDAGLDIGLKVNLVLKAPREGLGLAEEQRVGTLPPCPLVQQAAQFRLRPSACRTDTAAL
mmetsp:Transcript_51947/g.92716  ORF Transcript_51947/g.92716 Transcript_51947/m.92716 type:complete len:93 (-) Transcript_51947:256-534(-)